MCIDINRLVVQGTRPRFYIYYNFVSPLKMANSLIHYGYRYVSTCQYSQSSLLLLLPLLATFNNLNILPRGGGFRARKREKERKRDREKEKERGQIFF